MQSIKILERTNCSALISDEETLTNEDKDNTHDEDYVMNASKSSFNGNFLSQDMMICHYVIDM